jgi:hypothetical protein
LGTAGVFTAFGNSFSLRGTVAGTYDIGDSVFDLSFGGFQGVFGSAGDDTVLGSDAANDTLSGGNGADFVNGRGGDDLFRPLFGEGLAGDTFVGGAGFDTVDFRSGAYTDLSDVTLQTMERIEVLNGETLITPGVLGTAGVFTAFGNGFSLRGAVAGTYDVGASVFDVSFGGFQGLFGSAGDDTVLGNDAADDTLSGGNGADFLNGRGGNDLFRPLFGEGLVGDTLVGGAGFDTADFRTFGLTDLSGVTLRTIEQIELVNGATLITPDVLGTAGLFTAFGNGYSLRGTIAGTYRIGESQFDNGFGSFGGVFGSGGGDI